MKRTAHRAKEIARARNQPAALRRANAIVRGEQGDDLTGGNARRDLIYRDVAHYPAGIENEYGRFRYASLFRSVIDAPFPGHAAMRVAQDREIEVKFITDSLGFFRVIDGNGGEIRASRANGQLLVAIVRQLAKAEGSPMPAVENQHQRVGGAKVR